MQYFARAYRHKLFRIPFKFLVSFLGIKIAGDTFFYLQYGTSITLPRAARVVTGQNPLNPPVPMPYWFPKDVQSLEKVYEYNRFMKKMSENNLKSYHQIYCMYPSQPQRENPDDIDHFIYYARDQQNYQNLQYLVLKKFLSQQQFPDGINQLLRQLQQYKLNFHTPLVPQL